MKIIVSVIFSTAFFVQRTEASAIDPCKALCIRDGPSVCTGGSWTKEGGICHGYLFRGDPSRGDYCYHTGRTAATCPSGGAPVRVTDIPRLLVPVVLTTIAPTTLPQTTTAQSATTNTGPQPAALGLAGYSRLFKGRFGSEDDLVELVERASAFRHAIPYLLGRPEGILDRYWNIVYIGESGNRHRAARLDWFFEVTHQILNPATGIFRLSAEAPHYVEINPSAPSRFLQAVGRFLALAIAQQVLVPLNLPVMFYARLLGNDISLDMIENEEPALFNSLTALVNATIDDLVDVEITIGNRAEAVTISNRQDIIRRKLASLIPDSQMSIIRSSFSEVIPQTRNQVQPAQLKLVIEGEQTIDVETIISGASMDSLYSGPVQETWLFQTLRTLSQSELRLFLRFVTGSSCIPASGSVSWTMYDNGGFDGLPTAAPRDRSLYLSTYSNREEMRLKLLIAINQAEG